MEINAIRMNNYRTLLQRFRAGPEEKDKPEFGMLTRFADFCGISPRYLSHITHGRKKFSDSMARQIETGMALPHGWMDNVHDDEPLENSAEREFVDMALQLFRDNPLEVQRLMMQYMLARKLPSKR